MSPLHTIVKDKNLRTGWLLLIISLLIFSTPFVVDIETGNFFGLFMCNFAISIFYYFLVRMNHSQYHDSNRIHYTFINLILFLISAYSLNRELEVFSTSATWFSVLLILVSMNYLASAFFNLLHYSLRNVIFFNYGVSIIVFIYLSLYLLPMYAISLIGLIAIGVSIHTFVPGFFIYYTVRIASKLGSNTRIYWLSFSAGIISTIIVCVAYVVSWNNNVNRFNSAYTAAMAEGDNKLPVWVQVAQKTGSGDIMQKILKTDLIYTSGNWNDNFLWNVPKRTFGEEQEQHDPLVILSNIFSRKIAMPEEERIKVLESQYNSRHEALNRLWSGEHLRTENVASHIRIWPELHLSYTEKFLTVYNFSQQSWRGQEEAVYTLHMPEGAVVTSLSLWINGKEEKGILTSKQKAETAYNTIVGVESRDPSVVHWQEGNTVSIRVFPVFSRESRTFKVGITAPLRSNQGQLAYDNIWFQGPDAVNANETVKLEMLSSPKSFVRDASYSTSNNTVFTRSGKYNPVWSLAFDDLGMQENYFSFNGYRYSIVPNEIKRVPVHISDVYLDLNSSWTSKELDEVWTIIKDKRIWIYNEDFQIVGEGDREQLLNEVKTKQFSLFPFHLIRNREHSLVISKSGNYSPNLSDLEGSTFLRSLREKTDDEQRVKLFHLGNEFSPYLRSLKEFRLFDFEYGNANLLAKLFEHGTFIREDESEDAVIIHSADIRIVRIPGETRSNAPDHLMRLFAYNQIMQKLGRNGLTKEITDSTLVNKANEAYVVSPVSSLVVLEKKADYERFDIKDSGKSLKNASLKNNGAVPEPAEWAMIIIIAAVFVLFMFKWKLF
jgi:XrtN system VIT domain protein